MSKTEAEALSIRISRLVAALRNGLDELHRLVAQAKAGNAHVALGYASWTAYLAATLGKEPLRLGREERQQLVGYLAGEGERPLASAAR